MISRRYQEDQEENMEQSDIEKIKQKILLLKSQQGNQMTQKEGITIDDMRNQNSINQNPEERKEGCKQSIKESSAILD